MNFLNDSLKTLKNVLAEGLDQKVDFDGMSSDPGGTEEGSSAYQERDNLMKLCQHQSGEVRTVQREENLFRKVVPRKLRCFLRVVIVSHMTRRCNNKGMENCRYCCRRAFSPAAQTNHLFSRF